MSVPAWAPRLSAGAPDDVVARCLQVAVTARVDPDRLRDAVAQRLAAGDDPDAEAVIGHLQRSGTWQPPLPLTGDPPASPLAGAAPPRVGRAPRAPAVPGVVRSLLAAGARMHVVGYPPYPSRLAAAWPELGAPLWLFVRSPDGALPDGPAVAVVGTRRPTLDGVHTARALGRLLAERGVAVVSGMARGIDQAAHCGALDVGGATVAVLGTGLDVDYPTRDGALRDAVAAAGGLVTEFLPGTRPRPRNFLWRNRIIAGLADATVVVEGGARSGALHTARLAAAQGREVLAVPGSINQPTSRGPLDLIRDGAMPVTRLDDVLTAVGVAAGPGNRPDAPAVNETHVGSGQAQLAGPAAAVFPLLGPAPSHLGALAAAAGLPMPAVMAAIGDLVARGLACHTPNGITRALGR